MNKLERKLYNLITEEGDIVKNKKTGNVYMVKKFDPSKHDKPSPAEIEKAKASNGGEVPKGEKPKAKPAGKTEPTGKTAKQPTGGGGSGGSSALNAPPQQKIDKLNPAVAKQKAAINKASSQSSEKPNPQKIASADFKSDAEKSNTDDKENTQLKSLMPGMDTTKKGLDDVSPIERQKISAKIDELAKMGAEAKAKGEKAPNFNLCKVTIPGTNLYCEGNKGIERADMPQFKGTPRPGSPADKLPKDENGEADTEEFFKKMLNDKGIKVSEPTAVPPDRLKATQSELVGVKVAGMSKVLDDPKHPAYDKITAPIYVSNDGYVLDGHHRWAAVVAHNAANPDNQIDMKVRVIDQPIKPLVKTSNDFAEHIGIKAKAADTGAGGGPAPIAENKIIKLSSLLK
jgi:hypothetical protein